MPKYRITAPDGKTYEVTAPDGATQEQVLAYAQQNYGKQAPAADFGNVQGGADTRPAQSGGYLQQRAQELRGLGDGIRYSLADTALGIGQMLGGADEQDVDDFRRKRAMAAEQGGEFFRGGQMVGDAGQAMLPMGGAAGVGKLAQYARAGAGGAAFGATRSVGEGESRLENTAVSGLAGIGGQAAAGGLLRLGQKAAQPVRDLYQAAQSRGISLTPAQLSESELVKRMSMMADRLPFSGASKREAAQANAFSEAVAKTVGEKGPMDQTAYANAAERIGDNFEQRMQKYDMPVSFDLLRRFAEVENEAGAFADEVSARAMKNVMERLADQGQTGILPGPAIKSLDSQLGKIQGAGGERAQYAYQMREALHDEIEKIMSPEDLALWKTDRQQYRNLMQLTDLVAKDNGVSPAKLMGRVTATKSGKKAMAKGKGGELGELARIGQQMKRPGSSGTAENIQAGGLGAGLVANPLGTLALLGTGNVAGRALNSSRLAQLLMRENRGNFITPLAPHARPLPLLLSRPAYADDPERP